MRNTLHILMLYSRPKLSLSVARCLSRVPGVTVHALAFEGRDALRFSRSIASCQSMNAWGNVEQQMKTLTQIVREKAIDIILPVDEDVILWAATYSDRLRELALLAPIPTPEMFHNVALKIELSEFLACHSLPRPSTVLYNGSETPDADILRLRFPVLVKPTQGLGGEGIRRFLDHGSLIAYLHETPNAAGNVVVQEYIDGYDIDCSLLASNGKILAYTIQRGTLAPRRPFAPPAGIEFMPHEDTLRVACQTVAALGWNGVAHIDCRFDQRDKKVKILEINPRFWLSLLGSLAMGVNFPYLSCLTALGETFPVPAFRTGSYAVAPRTAIRYASRKGFHLKDSALRYSAADPLPEIMESVMRWLARG